MIRFSIILVNYKAPHIALDCLRTVFPLPSYVEVIVVDNHSGDNSRELILGEFPQVIWIQMEYNSGFARGNNAGIRAAKGDVVLLLNSDTLNEENAIVRCYEKFIGSSYVGCGVQLLNADRSPQISGNFFMKGGLNHLMSLPYAGRLIRGIGLLAKVKKTNVPEAKGVVEVDWVNGAFLMVKKSAIAQAGLLDEDFFLYAEEIEWCSRLRKIGPLCIYGDLHVVHLMGITANQAFDSVSAGYKDLADKKGYQLILSGLVRVRKQFGIGWFLFHWLAYIFTIPFYLLVVLFRNILFLPHAHFEWKAWWGFTKNVCGLFRFLPAIISNKPTFYKVL